jgi:hypothetical protein
MSVSRLFINRIASACGSTGSKAETADIDDVTAVRVLKIRVVGSPS